MLELVSLFNSRSLCLPAAAAFCLRFSNALCHSPRHHNNFDFVKTDTNYICTELFLPIDITDVKTVQEVRVS